MSISPAGNGNGWIVPASARHSRAMVQCAINHEQSAQQKQQHKQSAQHHQSAHQQSAQQQNPPQCATTQSADSPSAESPGDNRNTSVTKPADKPANPRFSSGPCAKHPGWQLANLDTSNLGRSHRAKLPKARLASAIERSRELMQLPQDWVLGIVPGSDTGAFEMAMWSLLGTRAVDVLAWESFSSDWAKDLQMLGIENLNVIDAPYGELPDLQQVNSDHDLVFVANGTTSGVRLPDFGFIDSEREGLALCDATSAVFAQAMDYSRLDVVTWSWQKVLGGEAAHGMIALSPKAVARLEQPAPRPLPKLFRLADNGKLNSGIFSGATINTPSMLAVEDLHSALDWAEQLGGTAALIERAESNFKVIDAWVSKSDWVQWLAKDPATLSRTSLCLQITAPEFTRLDSAQQSEVLKSLLAKLETEQVAYDIANYRSAPTGFRIWGGATIESADLLQLTQWLDWVFAEWVNETQAKAGETV